MVKIDFAFDTKYGRFADALHLPDDHGLSDAEIEAMKQQRLDNWIAIVSDYSDISKAIDVPNGSIPSEDINKLLELADIRVNDVFYDLGCSVGEVIIAAAKTCGCFCVGVEASDFRFEKALANVAVQNLSDKITVIHDDFYTCALDGATVVYIYLSPDANQKLETKLFSLSPGTKIISYSYGFPNYAPIETFYINGREAYMWTVVK